MTKKTKDQAPANAAAVTTARKLPGVPFKCGSEWTGNANGRPKGSKHKLSEEFIAALNDHFVEHGVIAIQKVFEEDPSSYLRVIASIIPKDITVREASLEDLSDAELVEALDAVKAVSAAMAKPRKSKPLAN